MVFVPFVAQPPIIDSEYPAGPMGLLSEHTPSPNHLIAALGGLQKYLYPQSKYPKASPDILWHYTGAEATRLILKEGILRMTNIRFMNDFSEYQFALEKARQSLEALSASLTDEEKEFLLPRLIHRIDLLEGSTVYVACFSGVRDLLSQWNGYASRGYAIGFDSSKIVDVVTKNPALRLFPCLYEAKHQQVAIDAAIAEVRSAYTTYRSMGHSEVLAGDAAGIFSEIALGQVIPYIKNSAYKEEGEWRVATLPSHVESPVPLKFVARGACFTPFTEFSIRDDDEPEDSGWLTAEVNHLVKEIMVAPPAGDDQSAPIPAGLCHAAQRYGYRGITISGSEIPHRVF